MMKEKGWLRAGLNYGIGDLGIASLWR